MPLKKAQNYRDKDSLSFRWMYTVARTHTSEELMALIVIWCVVCSNLRKYSIANSSAGFRLAIFCFLNACCPTWSQKSPINTLRYTDCAEYHCFNYCTGVSAMLVNNQSEETFKKCSQFWKKKNEQELSIYYRGCVFLFAVLSTFGSCQFERLLQDYVSKGS